MRNWELCVFELMKMFSVKIMKIFDTKSNTIRIIIKNLFIFTYIGYIGCLIGLKDFPYNLKLIWYSDLVK
jgi:hypothetical protein